MGRRVVSFSLWGNAHRYLQGMQINAVLVPRFYPEWELWVYMDQGLTDLADTLRALCPRIRLIPRSGSGGLLWRFAPAGTEGVEAMISRDADSRPSAVERRLVDEWLASGKQAHSIHAHPAHGMIFMGGLTGLRGGVLTDFEREASAWIATHGTGYNTDQLFLDQRVYPRVRGSYLIHATPDSPPWLRTLAGAEYRTFTCQDVPGGFPGAQCSGDCLVEVVPAHLRRSHGGDGPSP